MKKIIRKSLSPLELKTVATMTHYNDHTLARVFIANQIGDEELISSYEDLYTEHIKKGHLTLDLASKRNSLEPKLYAAIRGTFINAKEIIRSL